MPHLNISTDTILKIKESIDKTTDRAESEGFTDDDVSLNTLQEFCDFLLEGDDSEDAIRRYLSGQDMVIPR
jgi:hypothetical protein